MSGGSGHVWKRALVALTHRRASWAVLLFVSQDDEGWVFVSHMEREML